MGDLPIGKKAHNFAKIVASSFVCLYERNYVR
jgi:hypothetical protein